MKPGEAGRNLESQRGPPEQPDSWCLWSRDIREKVLEHVLHWYFLTSEWVWRWALRLERSAKARLQWEQEKGFSPCDPEQISQLPPASLCSSVKWSCSSPLTGVGNQKVE